VEINNTVEAQKDMSTEISNTYEGPLSISEWSNRHVVSHVENFSRMHARRVEPIQVDSTWASGNQKCSGYVGVLAKTIINRELRIRDLRSLLRGSQSWEMSEASMNKVERVPRTRITESSSRE
jgi:hypothetical protein